MEKVIKTTLFNCKFDEFSDWVIANSPTKEWLFQTLIELRQRGDIKIKNLSTVIKEEDAVDVVKDLTDYQDPYYESYNESVYVNDTGRKIGFVYSIIEKNPVTIIKIIKAGYIPDNVEFVKEILLMNNEYLTKLLFKNSNQLPASSFKISDEVFIPYIKSKDCFIRKVIASFISFDNLKLFIGETNGLVITEIIDRFNNADKDDRDKMKNIMSYILKNKNIRSIHDLALYLTSTHDLVEEFQKITNEEGGLNKLKKSTNSERDNLFTDKEYDLYNAILSITKDQDKLYQLIVSNWKNYRKVVSAAIIYLVEKHKISIPNLYKLTLLDDFSGEDRYSFYKHLPATVYKLIMYAINDDSVKRFLINNRVFFDFLFSSNQFSYREKVDFLYQARVFDYSSFSGVVVDRFTIKTTIEDPKYLIGKFNKDSKFFEEFIMAIGPNIKSKYFYELTNVLLSGLNDKNYEFLCGRLKYLNNHYASMSEVKEYIRLNMDIAINDDKDLSKIVKSTDPYNVPAVSMYFKMIFIKMVMSIYNDNYSDLISIIKAQPQSFQNTFMFEDGNYFEHLIFGLYERAKINSYEKYINLSYFDRLLVIAQTEDKQFLQSLYEHEQKFLCPPHILNFIKQRYLDNNDIITNLQKQLVDLKEMISKRI